jgi:hypothetical protein
VIEGKRAALRTAKPELAESMMEGRPEGEVWRNAVGDATTYGLGLMTFCPKPAPPKEAMTSIEDWRKKCDKRLVDVGWQRRSGGRMLERWWSEL